MARLMEIFVIVNAACGIAAFVIAKGLAKKMKRKVLGEDRPPTVEATRIQRRR